MFAWCSIKCRFRTELECWQWLSTFFVVWQLYSFHIDFERNYCLWSIADLSVLLDYFATKFEVENKTSIQRSFTNWLSHVMRIVNFDHLRQIKKNDFTQVWYFFALLFMRRFDIETRRIDFGKFHSVASLFLLDFFNKMRWKAFVHTQTPIERSFFQAI